jgi:hypothetical protein
MENTSGESNHPDNAVGALVKGGMRGYEQVWERRKVESQEFLIARSQMGKMGEHIDADEVSY